jgi:putative ABC transport system permease protein
MTRADSPAAGERRFLERIGRDATLALRGLRRSPTFTVAAVAILALGIGMSTAMFTVYRAVIVARLPVLAQERLVALNPLDRGGAHLDVPATYLDDIRRNGGPIRDAAGVYHKGAVSLPLLEGDRPLTVNDAVVSPNFFELLGVRPVLGRLLRRADGDAGAEQVIVVSYEAWRRMFNEDSLIVGRTLIGPYDHARVRIVGVAPPGFGYPAGAEIWAPLRPEIKQLQVDIVARLAPGATLATARDALFALLGRDNPFEAEAPGKMRAALPSFSGVEARAFADVVLGDARPAVVILSLAIALLLVVACVNVGNLLLVRNVGRAREIAVRRAIGASYGDIARQFLVESCLLAVAGGVLGVIASQLLLRLLVAFAPPELPRTDVIRIGGAPIAVAAGVTLAAVILFGLVPSLAAARTAPYLVLRADARAGANARSRRRARRWLVSSQMALALIMLAGALLLARSLLRLERLDLGYRPEHVALLSFTGPQSLFPTPARQLAVADQLADRLRATPGVTGVSPVESPPFKGQSLFIMRVVREGDPPANLEGAPYIPWEVVGPQYFRVFDIPILRGRGFTDADSRNAEHVVVVSEMLAKRLWPASDPIGKRLRDPADTTGTLMTVVGIARDTHFRTLRDAAPVLYIPWHQAWFYLGWSGYLAVRTQGELAAVLPSIRRTVHDFDPRLILFDARTMDDLLAGPLAQPRTSTLLLSAFSLVALLLAAIGLYGVMSSAVRQQTRDIGVRVALGAAPRDVRRLVLGEAMRVVGIGAAIGVLAAYFGSRLLASLLFGVSPGDPVSLAGAAALLVAIGAAAAYLPAHRATRIDPVQALRAD